jgi:hypothetical protein
MERIKCCCKRNCLCKLKLNSLVARYLNRQKERRIIDTELKELKQEIMDYADEDQTAKTEDFNVKWSCAYQERMNKELAKEYLTDSMISKCCNTSRYITLRITEL